MALTKITPQMFDTSAAGHDFNIDNGTFVVDASANRVGIGTDTPSSLLHVNGALTATTIAGTLTTAAQTNITSVGTLTGLTSSSDITATAGSNAAVLTTNGSIELVRSASNAFIDFKTTTSEDYDCRIQQASNGFNFATGGQGSTSLALAITSDQKLLVGDTASHTDDLLQIETPASGGGHGIQLRRNDANTNQTVGRILFGNNTDTDLAQIGGKTDGDTNSGDSGALFFSTQPTGGSLTERMRITSRGSVGIGVTPPSDSHSSWGQLFIGEKGSLISERLGNSGYYGTLLSDNLYIDADTGAFANITTDESSLYSQEAGSHKFYSQGSGSAGAAVTLAEKMRIDSSGVVGIAEGGVRYASRFSVGKPLGSTPGSAFTSSPSSFFSEATLGGTTGNSQKIVTFAGADTTNVSGLSIYRYRRATGTNWTTDGFSLRQEVDNSASIYDYMNFAAGNVGVGTSDPNSKLHAFYTSSNANPLSEAYAGLNLEGSSSVRMLFGTDQAAPYAGYIQASNTGSGFPISLNPSGGNIGINTTSPLTPFQIAGNSTNAFFFHPAYQSIGNNLYYNGSAWAALNTSIGGSVLQLGAGSFSIRRSTAANPPVLSYTIYSDSSGKIGTMGILDPTEAFEVYGSINARYQSNNFGTGAQRAFMDIINSSKIVRIGSLTGAATPTGSQGGVDITVNNSTVARFDVNGNLAMGGYGNMPTITHKTNTSITASQSTGNSWTATSGEAGTYSARGSIEVAGVYNRHVMKFGFTGNLSAQTYYPFVKRSELTSAMNQTGGGSEDGFAVYFRIYAYLSSVGIAEYGTNRLSNMIWINNFGSNSVQTHYFNLGPGFGHAPNTGDSGYGETGQFRLRVRHRMGNDSTFPSDQTIEIYSNSALTGLNPGVVGKQLLIYAYIT